MNFTLAELEEVRRPEAPEPVSGQALEPGLDAGHATGQAASGAATAISGPGTPVSGPGPAAPTRQARQPHQARRSLNLLDRSLLPPPPDWASLGLTVLALVSLLSVAAHGLLERRGLAVALAASAPAESAEQTLAEDPEWRQLSEQTAQRSALRNALREAGAGAEHISTVLGAVSAALPPDMWLNEIELRPGPSLRIEGQALEMPSLLRFSEGLARVQVLRGMPIQSVQVQTLWPEQDGSAAPEIAAASAGQPGHESAKVKATLPIHQFRLTGGKLKEAS